MALADPSRVTRCVIRTHLPGNSKRADLDHDLGGEHFLLSPAMHLHSWGCNTVTVPWQVLRAAREPLPREEESVPEQELKTSPVKKN